MNLKIKKKTAKILTKVFAKNNKLRKVKESNLDQKSTEKK